MELFKQPEGLALHPKALHFTPEMPVPLKPKSYFSSLSNYTGKEIL
jgi:hypothetical protein